MQLAKIGDEFPVTLVVIDYTPEDQYQTYRLEYKGGYDSFWVDEDQLKGLFPDVEKAGLIARMAADTARLAELENSSDD